MDIRVTDIVNRALELLKLYSPGTFIPNWDLKSDGKGYLFKLELKPKLNITTPEILPKKKRVSPSQRKRRTERKRLFLNKKRNDVLQSEATIALTCNSSRTTLSEAAGSAPCALAASDMGSTLNEKLSLSEATAADVDTVTPITFAVSITETGHSQSADAPEPVTSAPLNAQRCSHYGKRLIAFVGSYIQHAQELRGSANIRLWYQGLIKPYYHVESRTSLSRRQRKEIGAVFETLQEFASELSWNYSWSDVEERPPADPDYDCLWCEQV